MSEIDFEASNRLADSGFDSNTVVIIDHFGNECYINDPFLTPQLLLSHITELVARQGYIRLSLIPRDVEDGAPPRVTFFAAGICGVRSLSVDEVGG